MAVTNPKPPKKAKYNLGNFLHGIVLTLGILSLILIVGYLTLLDFSWGFSWQLHWPFSLIVLVLIILGATIQALNKSISLRKTTHTVFSHPSSKHRIYYGLITGISLLTIGCMTYIAWLLLDDAPPQFFPFDDPEATYTITKHNDKYWLIYDSKGDMNTWMRCTRGPDSSYCENTTDRHVQVMIGNSQQDLASLVDTPVQVRGNFEYASKQCIAGNCQDIGGWAVLHIDSIEKVR